MVAAQFHTDTKDTARTEEIISRWDECSKKYFGPDRDTKNFPMFKAAERPPPVALGFLPRSWFDALYDKTGVAGPYFALSGLVVFLMSKEIWVVDHAFFEFAGFWAAVIFIVKKWGKSIDKFCGELVDTYNEAAVRAPIAHSRKAFSTAVGKIDSQIAEEARHSYVYDVQQENLDMQLEARYRERVGQVYNAVKRRLDYQVELVNTRKRFEQQHMVDWIVNSVVQGITPKQEKDAITSCIANLKALSKAQTAV